MLGWKLLLYGDLNDIIDKYFRNALVSEARRTAKRSDYAHWASEQNAMLEIKGGDVV